MIIQGNALDVLKTLDSESVDCCVTSPPYWGLRNYGVEGQLGLEPTFQEYIQKLCDIFDEVKRVLKQEGTCFVNLGDCYAGSGKGIGTDRTKCKEVYTDDDIAKTDWSMTGLPDKSLCQIPSRFSIEMADRGWILRNEIIWHKPNCMTSSAKDRFTVDFEKVFFFVKNKKYYFDAEAISEPKQESSINRVKYPRFTANNKGYSGQYAVVGIDYSETEKLKLTRNKRTVWTISTQSVNEAHFATFPEDLVVPMIKAGCPEGGTVLDPFFGAGTTGLVAKKLFRNYIGIELNPEYVTMAERRIEGQCGGLF